MAFEMNVLNGIFYKTLMFQQKYHRVEIKYLSFKTDVGIFFADVIMLFLDIHWHLPRAEICYKSMDWFLYDRDLHHERVYSSKS